VKPTVTPASPADRADLVALLAAQMAEHDIAIDDAALGAAIDGVFADARRGLLLLARTGGRAAGVAYVSLTWSLEHGGQSCWLEELYVLPALRERGIGTELLRGVLDLARTRGLAAVDLEIEASHARVAALYGRHGFRQRTRARWYLPLR
jgi:GNAT superfamily N-acetyltransferase